MSNRVCIQPCVFIDYDLYGREVDRYYGYRIYDDYAMGYNNNFASLEEAIDACGPNNVVETVANHDTGDFYDAIMDGVQGLYIGNVWYNISELEK